MKSVKKNNLYILFICFCISYSVNAQQRLQYTTQILQGFLQNPALAGIEKYHDLRLIYNQQWTGFEGSPTAKGIGFSSQVGVDSISDNKLKTLPLKGRSNNEISSLKNKPTTRNKIKAGWGTTLISEGDGTINISEICAIGALHIPLKQNNLSVGLGLGLAQHQFNPANIKLINNYDLTFAKQQQQIIYPTVQLGAMYYTNEFFVGFSTKQLISKKFSYDFLEPLRQSKIIAHNTITAGLNFKPLNSFSITPSVIYRYVKNAPFTADINAMVDYKDLIKAGFMYRTNGDIALILGIIANHKYSVQYAYDISGSGVRSLYSNTHNLVVSIRFFKSKMLAESPSKFW